MGGGEEWSRNASRAAHSAKRAAEARFSPLGPMDLDHHLRHGPDHGDFGGNAVYLAPPRDQINAPTALWCRWDLRQGKCAFWYYVGMWLRADRFIGYRFEMPERGDNHNYYHSQPCRAMGRRQDEIKEALPIPVGNPTWPLAAGSALELLLCVVASLHGMEGLRALDKSARVDPRIRREGVLDTALRGMFSLQSSL